MMLCMTVPLTNTLQVEAYLQLFSRLLQAEAKMRGFDPQKHGKAT